MSNILFYLLPVVFSLGLCCFVCKMSKSALIAVNCGTHIPLFTSILRGTKKVRFMYI